MRRYILTVIFSIAIIGLYHFVDITLFSFDLTRRTKEKLFDLRNVPEIDQTVVLFNVGKLAPNELQEKIDSLLIAEPRRIGVNLCHLDKMPGDVIENYKTNRRVVFVNCDESGIGSLSQIIGDPNTVTHFKTDRPDYFELQLTDFKGRGNDIERINYGPKLDYPIHKGELDGSYYWFNPDHLKDKTVLIGYMGDYLTESIYYFRNCRISPLNQYYGEDNILPDMYDIEISANILRTINYNEFINDVDSVVRVLIILAFSLLNVIVLTFFQTGWRIVDLLIAAVLFIVLTALGSLLIVLAFDRGFYLELDELPLVLLVTTVFTVLLNIRKNEVDVPAESTDKI